MDWRARQCAVARIAVLVGGEGVLIFCSVALFLARRQTVAQDSAFSPAILLITLLITLLIQASLFYRGLYDPFLKAGLIDQMVSMVQAMAVAVGIMLVAGLTLPGIFHDLKAIVFGLMAVFTALTLWRLVFRALIRSGLFDNRVILLGTEGRAMSIYHSTSQPQETRSGGFDSSVKVVAVADVNCRECRFALQSDTAFKTLNNCRELVDLASRCKTPKIVVCTARKERLPADDIYYCKHHGIEFCDEETVYEAVCGQIDPKRIDPSELIFAPSFQRSLHRFLKRAGDMAVALILLAVFSPFAAALLVLNKAKYKGLALIAEPFVGLRKKIFLRYRFSPPTAPNPRRDPYSFKFRPLHALPQLWNVLKGDMSLVGPCPVRPPQASEIANDFVLFDERFTVRPGLTGWGQVNCGCDGSSSAYKRMFGFDLYYLKHMSLLLDIEVLCRTMKVRGFGVSLARNVA